MDSDVWNILLDPEINRITGLIDFGFGLSLPKAVNACSLSQRQSDEGDVT